MTDSKMEALARQLVACPRFRWRPGMLAVHSWRVHNPDELRYCRDGVFRRIEGGSHQSVHGTSGMLPDLRDPATLGWLLQLVRDAWGDPGAFVNRMTGPRVFWRAHAREQCGTRHGHDGDSEAEALVAALLAAPEAA